ncbi:hypothetical protein [Mycobacterium sp. E2238]|uniref:hypothetical protein n=1 Tax=Mycobacterium sp. E2238 TaxID=1834131 RepID=UPI0007FFD0E5|nr:hypothetical protein [Mycobacterium sp. E2238]OBI26536.1 hypothetical protein A5711_04955 [Mycobacterium sp. E2238]
MFDVDIWGTVAAWASAIGTGTAAIAAASYYILSTRNQKRAQARQVHVNVKFPERGKVRPYHFVLYNDSEDQISGFGIGRYKERRLIPSLFNYRVPFLLMRDDKVIQTGMADMLRHPKSELIGFDGRQGDFRLIVEGASRVLPPGESVVLKQGPNARFRWSTVYWIGFLDANGNRWEREVTNSVTTYGRLRKGKPVFFARSRPAQTLGANRRPGRLRHFWDVTRWVWRNRGLETYSQREPLDNVAVPPPHTPTGIRSKAVRLRLKWLAWRRDRDLVYGRVTADVYRLPL